MSEPLRFDIHSFIAWLRDRRHVNFGRRHMCACPIASWLSWQRPGTAQAEVSSFGSCIVGGEMFELPAWADIFVRRWDATDGDDLMQFGEGSGKQALNLAYAIEAGA